MGAVQVAVARVLHVDVEPHHSSRVIARAELQLRAQLGVAMEVEGGGLGPRVVCVAWVVGIATVDLRP